MGPCPLELFSIPRKQRNSSPTTHKIHPKARIQSKSKYHFSPGNGQSSRRPVSHPPSVGAGLIKQAARLVRKTGTQKGPPFWRALVFVVGYFTVLVLEEDPRTGASYSGCVEASGPWLFQRESCPSWLWLCTASSPTELRE